MLGHAIRLIVVKRIAYDPMCIEKGSYSCVGKSLLVVFFFFLLVFGSFSFGIDNAQVHAYNRLHWQKKAWINMHRKMFLFDAMAHECERKRNALCG